MRVKTEKKTGQINDGIILPSCTSSSNVSHKSAKFCNSRECKVSIWSCDTIHSKIFIFWISKYISEVPWQSLAIKFGKKVLLISPSSELLCNSYWQYLAVLCYNQIHLAYQSLISLQYSQLFLQCILGKNPIFFVSLGTSLPPSDPFPQKSLLLQLNLEILLRLSRFLELRNWLRLDLPATKYSTDDLSKFKFVLSTSRVSWNLSSVTATFSCTHFAASSVNSQRFAGSGDLIYHFSWRFFEQKPLNSIVGREIVCFFRFRVLTKIEWTVNQENSLQNVCLLQIQTFCRDFSE